MITSIFSQVDPLIQALKQEINVRLYQALQILSRGVDTVSSAAQINQSIVFEQSVAFYLPGVRTDATDTCETRPSLQLPRNQSNNLINIKNFIPRLKLHYVLITAKVPLAGGGPYEADILISRDLGVTWNSIFLAQKAQLIVGQVIGSNKIFSIGTLYDGDLFRIDETGTDGTLAGVQISMTGTLSIDGN